jgi:hypothetical protein
VLALQLCHVHSNTLSGNEGLISVHRVIQKSNYCFALLDLNIFWQAGTKLQSLSDQGAECEEQKTVFDAPAIAAACIGQKSRMFRE